MQKKLLAAVIIVGAAAVSGCANSTATNAARLANREAAASGSPFRWEAQNAGGGTIMRLVMIDLPSGPTRADSVLKKDVLTLIAKAEAASGRTDPLVVDIKRMPEGREVWILRSDQDDIAYIVGFKAAPDGGTDIELSGPTMFHCEQRTP